MSDSIFSISDNLHEKYETNCGAVTMCFCCKSWITCFYFMCSLFLILEAGTYVTLLSIGDFEHVVHEEFHQVMANLLFIALSGASFASFLLFSNKKNGYNIQTITSFIVNMCLRFWSLVLLSYFVDNHIHNHSSDWIDVGENIVVRNLLIESTTVFSVTSLVLIIWGLVEWTRSTCIKLYNTERELKELKARNSRRTQNVEEASV